MNDKNHKDPKSEGINKIRVKWYCVCMIIMSKNIIGCLNTKDGMKKEKWDLEYDTNRL